MQLHPRPLAIRLQIKSYVHPDTILSSAISNFPAEGVKSKQMVLSSKSGAEALLLLLLPAVSGHLDDATSSDRHRQTRHIHPTPEPTQEPTAKSEPASAETGEFSSWTAWGSRGNTSPDQSILDSNSEVWTAAASSPPIAAATNAPQTPIYDEITTGQWTMDENVAGNAQSAPGPLYALRHGRGAFAITGGTGCYSGARGQAQANFGAQSSHVHLFVPSISLEVDDIRVGENGMGPQDTTWNRDRRMQGAQECNLFRKGADSFTIMSLDLERRSNPPDTKFIKKSGSSYHEHGEFWAQEEWFEGISGEYSLSCVHHECLLSFHFGIGPSTSDSSSTTEKKRTLANDEDGGDGDHIHWPMTSLSLQGTTELAFQGEHTDLLVCVENCGEMGSTYSSEIAVDVEHYEAINLRNFDNTESLVQLDSNGKGKGKGKECYINTNECLVLACSGKGKVSAISFLLSSREQYPTTFIYFISIIQNLILLQIHHFVCLYRVAPRVPVPAAALARERVVKTEERIENAG